MTPGTEEIPDKGELSDEEEEKLMELRQRSELQNYRNRLRKELDGVPKSAIDIQNTGFDEFDERNAAARYKWIKQVYYYSGENNYVGVTTSGTIHFIDEWVSLLNGSDFPRFLCGTRHSGNYEQVEEVNLTNKRYCNRCLDHKLKMAGAKKAIAMAKGKA